MTQGAARVPELDGLRGLACLLVLVCHYVHMQVDAVPGTAAAQVLRLLEFTWSGVDLFFVLSGFLLGGILLDHRGSPNLLPVFYIRRTCRIFPLYFAWLALFVLARPFLADSGRFARLFEEPFPLWSYATYFQNFLMAQRNQAGPGWLGVTWSLAVEEQFYLLLPALVLLTPPRRLPWLLAGLILAAPVCRAAVVAFFPHHALTGYFLLPCRWDALFLGVLGAWAVRRPAWQRRLPQFRRWGYILLLFSAAGILGLMKWSPAKTSPILMVGGYTWIAGFYLLLLLLALYTKPVAAVVRNRPLMFLGSISYGTYLIHPAVAGLLHGQLRHADPRMDDLAGVAVTAAALGLTILLAWASYTYFEAPILSVGRRWKYEKRSSPVPDGVRDLDGLPLRPAEA
jgi:peptidoglycan/LPS O-acetylase OafA/YrhL